MGIEVEGVFSAWHRVRRCETFGSFWSRHAVWKIWEHRGSGEEIPSLSPVCCLYSIRCQRGYRSWKEGGSRQKQMKDLNANITNNVLKPVHGERGTDFLVTKMRHTEWEKGWERVPSVIVENKGNKGKLPLFNSFMHPPCVPFTFCSVGTNCLLLWAGSNHCEDLRAETFVACCKARPSVRSRLAYWPEEFSHLPNQ